MSEVRIATRRDFLNGFFSAGALILAARVVPAGILPNELDVTKTAWNPSVYLGLDTDGSVIIVAHRSEMGTGVRTSLPMVVADELEADWTRVRVEQALGDAKYGSQDTDGSASILDFYMPMREAGATARLMLERAAAAEWRVPVGECRGQQHQVVHSSSGRKLAYGELVSAASKQPLPKKDEIHLKSPKDFRYIGKGVPGIDIKDVCTGLGMYGFDASMPGMVYASIERAPVLGGKLKSFDDSLAKKVTGVQQTVVIESAQAAVCFPGAGRCRCHRGQHLGSGTGPQEVEGRMGRWSARDLSIGFLQEDVDRSHASAAESCSALRRRRCGVRERQQSRRSDLLYSAVSARTHGAPRRGRGFSQRSSRDLDRYPESAGSAENGRGSRRSQTGRCALSRHAARRRVRAQIKARLCCRSGHSFEEDWQAGKDLLDTRRGYPLRLLSFDLGHVLQSGVGHSGHAVRLAATHGIPPIGSTFDNKVTYAETGDLTQGFTDMPFDVPNVRAENGPAEPHLRIGWLRSVANVYHAFGVQSFIDELAQAADQDPAEYWLKALGAPRKMDFKAQNAEYDNYGKPLDQFPVDTGKLRRVAELALERSGWANRKSGNGSGWGFAAHRSFLTYVAAVVEIEVDSKGKLRIPRVDLAVDCGRVIHPDLMKAQFEGASVFGASIALLGEITAADGRVQQGNFNTYPVARMNEAPYETHVHVIASDEPPTGVGEPGVPPMSPAIANAVYAATGKRIRELPIRKQKLV